MIRLATRTDFADIIVLLQDYFLESSYGHHVMESVDQQYATRLLFQVSQQGRIWLSHDDDKLTGILAVSREANTWFPKKIAIKEFIWFVKKEYRSTSAGGRLFVAYEQWAQQELNMGRAHAYFMTEMSTTKPIDLERRGFRLAERLYIKD